MNEVSFREKIVALKNEYQKDVSNYNRNNDFWYIMDSINDDLVFKWAERAAKIRHPTMFSWDPEEWRQLCQILNDFKHFDPMIRTEPWTKKQKRFCTFMIVKYWDDLEMSYYC